MSLFDIEGLTVAMKSNKVAPMMPAISESGELVYRGLYISLTRGSAEDQKNSMLSQLLDQAARARRMT